MHRLTDLFLDGEFDEVEYREKRKLLEQKRDEIVGEIESNNRSDNNFAEGMVSTLKLASGQEKRLEVLILKQNVNL